MKIYYDGYMGAVCILHGYDPLYEGYEFSFYLDTIGM